MSTYASMAMACAAAMRVQGQAVVASCYSPAGSGQRCLDKLRAQRSTLSFAAKIKKPHPGQGAAVCIERRKNGIGVFGGRLGGYQGQMIAGVRQGSLRRLSAPAILKVVIAPATAFNQCAPDHFRDRVEQF